MDARAVLLSALNFSLFSARERRAHSSLPALLPQAAACTATLFGQIAERFFLGSIVVGARLVAEAPHVIERLIAVPAGAFRFQRRRVGNEMSGGFDAVFDVVCLIHDFATKNTLPSRRSCPDRNDKSIVLSTVRKKTSEKK